VPDGRGAQFALVRVPGQIDDFYLDESEFDSTDRRVFDYTPDGDDLDRLPDPGVDALGVYQSLPTLSEMSIVDLGLSTHVLPWALYLGEGDDETTASAASVTTVQSTFSFSFDPHPACDTTLQHRSGQVEVDAIVPACRDDGRLFVVIEAKRYPGRRISTLWSTTAGWSASVSRRSSRPT